MPRTNLPPSGFTIVEIMIVCVIIGLLSSLALPAFQRIRQTSQDRAVFNNARQLSSAADQYYLESGDTTVAIGSLVGSLSYVKTLNLVANENYPDNYTQGEAITVSGIAGTRTITYGP
ncbi:MAG: type II secretion system protein [Verrucomicrobiota bacterium]|nr:type II secretion system protein [Opitutales bacterium]